MPRQLSLYCSRYEDCVEELIEFRNVHRDIQRDGRYFEWRYLQRPCAIRPVVVWAEREGSRVGALTVFGHDYFVLDGEYPVGVLGDISVRKECRGLGIAGAMFRFLPQVEALRGLRGLLVLPNEEAAAPFRKAGWHEAERIQRAIKVLDLGPRLRALLGGSGLAGAIAAPLNRVVRGLSWEGWYREGNYRSALAPTIDDRFDELWCVAEKRGRVVGVRNARYLRWRYQDHPTMRYRMLTVSEGDALCGYVMYRITHNLCQVDDAFCIYPARHGAHIVGQLLAHVRSNESVSTVSLGTNRSFLDLPWGKFGFVRRSDYQSVMVSGSQLSGGGVWSGSAGEKWHLMAGDKDV